MPMKKYLLLIALITFSLNNSFAQWTNSGPDIGANKMRQNNSRIYLFNSRLYHSDNNGNSWQVENTPAVTFNDLFFLPSKILAATDKGIFVSYDNGINWISHNSGVTDSTNGTRDIAQIGTRLILATTSRIYYSDNNADSWTLSNISGANVRQIAIVNGVVLVCAFVGIYRSTDNGLTYITSNSGISGASPNIANLFTLNNVLYAHKANTIEIYKSTDDGLTWTLCNSGLIGSTGNISIVNSKLYFGNVNGLKEFDSNANLWAISPLNQSISGNVTHFYNNKYYGLFSNSPRLVATSDNGNSWNITDNEVFMATIEKFNVTNSNRLFGFSSLNGAYLYNQINGLWSRFTPYFYDFGGAIASISTTKVNCIENSSGNNYYIGTEGGVWSSIDSGITWIQHHSGLPITNTTFSYKTVNDLYINGNVIIAATAGGIYRSTDQANSWTQVSPLSCNDLHKYGSYLYATGNGVYRSNDNGLTWTAFAGATSGGPFTYITGAGGKLFTSTDASSTPGNTLYADTLAASFSSLTTNIGGAFGYGDYLFLSKFYINTALSLSNQIDMTDNLPCYYASQTLGCIETYLNRNVVYGDKLWLGTNGFSTWYRSIGDFGFPVGLNNTQTEKLEFKPFPNPANEIIYFNNLTKADQIEIFNNLGQLQRITLNIDNNGIDISNLAKGFYIYAITDQQNGRKSTGKFIKE